MINLDSEVKTASQNLLVCFAKLMMPDYQVSRVHSCIAWHLERVEAGEIKRLMVACPPRAGKSTLISRLFAAWYLGRNVRNHVMCATYGQDLATDHGRAVKHLMTEDLYRLVFPNARMSPDSEASNRLDLLAGGGYRAVGRGGPASGRNCSVALVDDLLKDMSEADSPTVRRHLKEWWTSVLMRRLPADGSGAVVIVSTRWHEDDVIGWQLQENPDDWHFLNLRALREDDKPCCDHGDWRQSGEVLWPERQPVEALKEIERELGQEFGPRVWNSLYQQNPTVALGAIFQREWLNNEYHEHPACERMLQYWDCKLGGSETSGSYVVGQAWGRTQGKLYLLDQVRFRGGLAATEDAVMQLSERWPQSASAIYVEDKAAGPSAIERLRSRFPGIQPDSPRGSKEQRAEAIAPLFRAGSVFLPSPKLASWIGAYREELVSFPRGRNDDQVDATAAALRILTQTKRRVVAGPAGGLEKTDWTR